MKFVLMIFQGTAPLPGSGRWNALSTEEQAAIYTDYKAVGATPGVEQGLPLGLPSAARTVTLRDGALDVREGTYLSEGAGGYLVLDAENLDAAIALARCIPAARLGGAIEIRPAEQYW